ncbi:hypothetical protein [Streptomyces sp. NPDC047046]|uniref:hypothetical protein n=1 Tax=Streptomyces sp. NPDC047046 TaxID=3155378 RepID=UPI003401EAFB
MLALPLLLLVPLAALALCGVVFAALFKAVSLALPGGAPRERGALARWGARLLAVLAVSVYVLGAGLVLFDVNESSHGADSSPAPACRDVDAATAEGLWSARHSYLPLGFTCVRQDGSTYAGEPVLRWCNGVGLGGLVGAVLLSGTAVAASRREPEGEGGPASHEERPGAPGQGRARA